LPSGLPARLRSRSRVRRPSRATFRSRSRSRPARPVPSRLRSRTRPRVPGRPPRPRRRARDLTRALTRFDLSRVDRSVQSLRLSWELLAQAPWLSCSKPFSHFSRRGAKLSYHFSPSPASLQPLPSSQPRSFVMPKSQLVPAFPLPLTTPLCTLGLNSPFRSPCRLPLVFFTKRFVHRHSASLPCLPLCQLLPFITVASICARTAQDHTEKQALHA
jgi:hypothetical protein